MIQHIVAAHTDRFQRAEARRVRFSHLKLNSERQYCFRQMLASSQAVSRLGPNSNVYDAHEHVKKMGV